MRMRTHRSLGLVPPDGESEPQGEVTVTSQPSQPSPSPSSSDERDPAREHLRRSYRQGLTLLSSLMLLSRIVN